MIKITALWHSHMLHAQTTCCMPDAEDKEDRKKDVGLSTASWPATRLTPKRTLFTNIIVQYLPWNCIKINQSDPDFMEDTELFQLLNINFPDS